MRALDLPRCRYPLILIQHGRKLQEVPTKRNAVLAYHPKAQLTGPKKPDLVQPAKLHRTTICSLLISKKRHVLQVVSKPDLGRSGVYWSWNSENGSFENELSDESRDAEKARKLWDVSLKMVGLN